MLDPVTSITPPLELVIDPSNDCALPRIDTDPEGSWRTSDTPEDKNTEPAVEAEDPAVTLIEPALPCTEVLLPTEISILPVLDEEDPDFKVIEPL